MRFAYLLLACSSSYVLAAPIAANIADVKTGPISVTTSDAQLQVVWKDGAAHQWKTTFSLDSAKPLITAITVDEKTIVERANPVYRAYTGKRTGGWDAFFDYPPGNTDGTRSFEQRFYPTNV